MLKSLFNKLQASRPATLLKRDSSTGVFMRDLRNFLTTPVFTEEHLILPIGSLLNNIYTLARARGVARTPTNI